MTTWLSLSPLPPAPRQSSERLINGEGPAGGQPLLGGHNQPPAIIRLSNPSKGTLAPGVHPSVTRQLTLFEMESPTSAGNDTAGMPVIDLVNNTKWNGRRDGGGYSVVPGSRQPMPGQDVWVTETPRVGATEIWEFLNLTGDAHPIHVHLVQFQLLNRQAVVADVISALPTYAATWGLAFPGGTFNGETANGTWGPVTYRKGTAIPGYGPPGNYNTPNADGALGGNPAFGPFLTGPVLPPNPNEVGWKDVVRLFPLHVTRFVIRWAPQDIPIARVGPGKNLYSFDPTKGPRYVAHCHILDHEDNEMMRPDIPVP